MEHNQCAKYYSSNDDATLERNFYITGSDDGPFEFLKGEV
jgi:hypothetical protein